MQHLEMTRDVASRFNHAMGKTFVLPEAMTQEATMYVLAGRRQNVQVVTTPSTSLTTPRR